MAAELCQTPIEAFMQFAVASSSAATSNLPFFRRSQFRSTAATTTWSAKKWRSGSGTLLSRRMRKGAVFLCEFENSANVLFGDAAEEI